jgi:hypothetical protein
MRCAALLAIRSARCRHPSPQDRATPTLETSGLIVGDHRSRGELVIAARAGLWECPSGWHILGDGSHVCPILATPARRWW